MKYEDFLAYHEQLHREWRNIKRTLKKEEKRNPLLHSQHPRANTQRPKPNTKPNKVHCCWHPAGR